MLDKFTDKKLGIATLLCIGYFAFLYLNTYFFKLEFVLLGVLREIITIPMLSVLLFLLVVSIKFLIRDKFSISKISFWTFILVLISIILIGSSFFE